MVFAPHKTNGFNSHPIDWLDGELARERQIIAGEKELLKDDRDRQIKREESYRAIHRLRTNGETSQETLQHEEKLAEINATYNNGMTSCSEKLDLARGRAVFIHSLRNSFILTKNIECRYHVSSISTIMTSISNQRSIVWYEPVIINL